MLQLIRPFNWDRATSIPCQPFMLVNVVGWAAFGPFPSLVTGAGACCSQATKKHAITNIILLIRFLSLYTINILAPAIG